MLSSYLPWDFTDHIAKSSLQENVSAQLLWAFDPFIEKICVHKILHKSHDDRSLQVLTGNELTVRWCEDNFFTQGLFEDEFGPFLILQGESLSQEVKNFLLENISALENRTILISFGKKDSLFEQMAKIDTVLAQKISTPPFWESQKLLNFLAREMKIQLPYALCEYILSAVPNKVADFVHCLNILRLHTDENQKLSLEKIKELIVPTKLDHFELASCLSKKKRHLFYKKIVSSQIDYDEMRSLFSFMQRHFLKMSDLSYAADKKKPSKYDREISIDSKKWKEHELKEEIRHFGELEIEAKKRNPLIFQTLKHLASHI